MRRKVGFFSILLIAGGLRAQQAPIRGPVEAYTFDAPTMSFRAVVGSLGSSSLGPALVEGIEYGTVAPRRDYAIAVRNGTVILVTGLGSGQVAAAQLSGAFSTPEGVAWSEDASLAVLYSRAGEWIQPVRGLPAAPETGSPLSLSSLGGSLSFVAVSGRGAHIAIGMAGETGGLFEVTAEQNIMPLLTLRKPVAATFSADGGTLYFLDGSSRQLSALNWQQRTSQTLPLDNVQDPFALGAVRDGVRGEIVYVASRSDRRLASYEASTGAAGATVELDFEPTGIEPLGRQSFSLAARAANSDPLWSFVTLPQPAIYFVPATPLPTPGGQE